MTTAPDTVSPAIAFQGLRRRDHVVRYVSTAAYSALAVLGGCLTAHAMTPDALTLQALPPPEAAVNFLGTAAAGVAAYGWMRTCDAFNALRDNNLPLAQERMEANRGSISATASGFNNVMATAIPLAALIPATVTLTQLAVGVGLSALFSLVTQRFGESQIRMLAEEGGHPVWFRRILGEKGVSRAYDRANDLARARNQPKA